MAVIRRCLVSLKGLQTPKCSTWPPHALYILLSSHKPSSVGSGLRLQHSLSQEPPSAAQAAINHRSLYSSYKVTLGQAPAAADMGLHRDLSQEAQEPTHLVISVRPHQSNTQLAPHVAHPRNRLSRHQRPASANPTQNNSSTVVMAIPHI